MRTSKILVINPGSTSTKIAFFENDSKIHQTNIEHNKEELKGLDLWDQFPIRFDAVKKFIAKNDIQKLDTVVGRGGLLKPLKRGTYLVDENMINDAKKGVQGNHVANLGCALAFEISQQFNCSAYIVDPVSVDEFEPIVRISGHPLIERKTLSHALNLRAAAFKAAKDMTIDANKANFIVAHLGGGISVAPIKNGRIIDVNDASSSGPFSPERTGSLPLQQFMDLCFSGDYTKPQVKKMVMGEGGLYAYLGTSDLQEIQQKIDNGNENARLLVQAMAYQIAKEIGSMATVLEGKIAAIILTGGLAHSKLLVDEIGRRVEFISKIIIYAGEFEMEAMAAGALRILNGNEKLKEY